MGEPLAPGIASAASAMSRDVGYLTAANVGGYSAFEWLSHPSGKVPNVSSCVGLGGVREAMAAFAGSFDPALITAGDAAGVVADAARIEKMAATVKALAAARVADTELWRRSGAPSAAHDLARVAGTSVGEARDALNTASKFAGLPQLEAAARQGELSPRQAAAIADAAGVNPGAEARLVEAARESSLRELQDECARTKAAAEDMEARYRRTKKDRSVRHWTDPSGMGHLHAQGPVDDIARLAAAVDAAVEKKFNAARKAGEREPREAYAFDALVELTTTGGGAGGRPAFKIIIRIDWTALVRGYPVEGELCEIAGIGPVPVSLVKTLMASGDAFLAAVVTRGVDVANVAHLGRKPTAHQITAIDAMNPACVVLGCAVPGRYEIDHTVDWADTKLTWLRWLERLCSHHHDLKTHQGWALEVGNGPRHLVAPDDPRHPRNAHAPPMTA